MEYKLKSFNLHRFEGHIADLYIAEYADSLLLLDCGCRSDHKLIVNFITKTLHRPLEHLKLLVVTHFHPDHSGSAMSLSEKFNIPVAAPEDINLWYKGSRGSVQHLVDSFLAHIAARSRNMPLQRVSYPKQIKIDHTLKDCSTIPFFPDWQVYSVPGHTEHDIVLYNRAESLLYCSDTIVKIREKYLSPFPVTDKLKMSESLSRISKLRIKKIAMAHGGVSDIIDFPALVSDLALSLNMELTGKLKVFYPLTLFPEPLKKKLKIEKE